MTIPNITPEMQYLAAVLLGDNEAAAHLLRTMKSENAHKSTCHDGRRSPVTSLWLLTHDRLATARIHFPNSGEFSPEEARR